MAAVNESERKTAARLVTQPPLQATVEEVINCMEQQILLQAVTCVQGLASPFPLASTILSPAVQVPSLG